MKKVLIITYYWPPSAGSGVQRWLKFAKYLPEYGWEPVVFTPENPDFDLLDPALEKNVSPELEVLKFPIWEPYQVFRFFEKDKKKAPSAILENNDRSLVDRLGIWMRANLLIPDPRVFWVKPSVKFLSELCKSNAFKAIITTGPPHSMHLIGRNLKRENNLPWLADFRDPWSTWEFLDTLPMVPKVRSLHQKMESSVFAEADAIVTISPTFKQEMEKISGQIIHVLTNGFDPGDLPKDFFSHHPDPTVFEIVYTGIIDAIRDPIPFLKAFKWAFQSNNKAVKLTFVGKMSGEVKKFIDKDPWLSKKVFLAGYVAHREVFLYYQKAHLLLLILTQTKNAKGNIPGKLFEYMATGRQILALGDPDGDAAHIIKKGNAGEVFRHEAIPEIGNYLSMAADKPTNSLRTAETGQYSRKALTEKLAALLNNLQGV